MGVPAAFNGEAAGGLFTSIFADYSKGFSLQSLTQRVTPARFIYPLY